MGREGNQERQDHRESSPWEATCWKEERPQHSYKEKNWKGCKEGVEYNHPLTHSYGQYNGQDKALAGNMQ